MNEYLVQKDYWKLVEEVAKDLEIVETKFDNYDAKNCLKDKVSFHEFRSELAKNLKDMEFIKDSYSDPKKQAQFEKAMFVYKCNEFLAKRYQDY